MTAKTREIKSFFFSQYFSDGLRITLGILLPALIFAQFNKLDIGLTISLGAVCLSVVDSPGPAVHKRTALAVSSALVLIISLLTGFARLNVIVLGIEIALLSFIFSMFTVYGNRAASVGTAGLLVIIFVMDRGLQAGQILNYSLTIFAGAVWYMLMSLIFFGIRPYRAAQQALAENINDIASFLRIKASFYRTDTDIERNYQKLVLKQIQVSQHQDVVRELLFKSRLVVRESTNISRMLLLTFVDLVDLFEQIMATHYDYITLREKFASTDILNNIAAVIDRMADELENAAYAILTNSIYKPNTAFVNDIEKIKTIVDGIGGRQQEVSTIVLKKILINLRNLNQKILNIGVYYNARHGSQPMESRGELEYSRFVSSQEFSLQMILDNLTLKSAVFKHSLRVCLACIAGFIITKSSLLIIWVDAVTGKKLMFGHHSYWVLLTIIVILKPGFSLSKERNFQRLAGTIAGGLIGIVILTAVHNTMVQFLILVVLMIGAYSFQRINYIVSVILMTPYILILFKFLGVGHLNVAEERIADTVIGSVIAFIASYTLFPAWEYDTIRQNAYEVLNANINYLIKIAEEITGKKISVTELKLIRKDVYVKSANLSAAFERMTSEPKSKQRKAKEVHKFVVLNHILSSYIATMASGFSVAELHHTPANNLKLIKRSLAVLNESSKKLGGGTIQYSIEKVPDEESIKLNEDDKFIRDQLGFINRISNDIAKTTDKLVQQ